MNDAILDRTGSGKHGSEGRFKLGVIDVENPNWDHAKDGVGGIPRYVQMPGNVQGAMLDTLLRRKAITSLQYAAGIRYYETWFKAGLDQRMSANYDSAGGIGAQSYGMAITEVAYQARQDLRSARVAIVKWYMDHRRQGNAREADTWWIIEHVCCWDGTVTSLADRLDRKTGARSRDRAGHALKARLDVLVEHWSLA